NNAIYYGVRTFETFMNPLPATQAVEISLFIHFPRYAQLLGAKYYLSCPVENDIEWPAEGSGLVNLINPKNESVQTIDAGLKSRLAELTYKEGWVPLNSQRHPYEVMDFAGGQMFADPDRKNRAAPLNVIVGGGWSPAQ